MNRTVLAVLDVVAAAYLVAFAAACVAGLQVFPAPFGVLVPAALGSVAVIWILR